MRFPALKQQHQQKNLRVTGIDLSHERNTDYWSHKIIHRYFKMFLRSEPGRHWERRQVSAPPPPSTPAALSAGGIWHYLQGCDHTTRALWSQGLHLWTGEMQSYLLFSHGAPENDSQHTHKIIGDDSFPRIKHLRVFQQIKALTVSTRWSLSGNGWYSCPGSRQNQPLRISNWSVEGQWVSATTY